MEKIKREKIIKIIQIGTERQIEFEYVVLDEIGNKLFGWNNPKMPVEFVTKALFKPLPNLTTKEGEGK